MRNLKKRILSLVSVVALTATAVVAVPSTARAAAPVCTNKVILTECVGLTSDGAQYIFQVPAKFTGTLFLSLMDIAIPSIFQQQFPGLAVTPFLNPHNQRQEKTLRRL